MAEYSINVEDNGNTEFETVGDLIKEIEYWKQWATDNNSLKEFLNLKISLTLQDINGVNIFGDNCCSVGWSGERFVLVGNVQKVVE